MRKQGLVALTRCCAFLAAGGAAAGSTGVGKTTAAGGSPPSFILVDPGTLGGSQSSLDLPAVPLSPQGVLLGTADTTIGDLDYPNFNPFLEGSPDPTLTQAFEWKNGTMTNLGALPGNNGSAVFDVNGAGVGAGMSETSNIDPNTGWPSLHAVMFDHGNVLDLGTLPGGHESMAIAINDRGEISGFASNGTSDPFSIFGWGTEARSFIWEHGQMRDIGTLGGPDTVMTSLNRRGQISGVSYTNDTANAATGIPTLDPFLWHDGHMQDLGSLGGTAASVNWMNDAGEVVGASDLTGDQAQHPFLWNGHRLIDLGTLGGDNGSASWISGSGDVVGNSDLADGPHHAFLWSNGTMHDLHPINGAPCSNGNGVNDRGEAVGNSTDCQGDSLGATVWIHGVGYDLNTLIAPSSLHLDEADYISDSGEIVGVGTLPDGDQHVFLLIPHN